MQHRRIVRGSIQILGTKMVFSQHVGPQVGAQAGTAHAGTGGAQQSPAIAGATAATRATANKPTRTRLNMGASFAKNATLVAPKTIAAPRPRGPTIQSHYRRPAGENKGSLRAAEPFAVWVSG
jgi:hypothetical protein